MKLKKFKKYSLLEFSAVAETANNLANHIRDNYEEIINILLRYETYEVATDEISRTLDLLTHLEENEKYFRLRVGRGVSFLPRNQPLYAFICFVAVPSLMASEIHFRIPHSMRDFFPQLLNVLEVSNFFPNIYISKKERVEFLREHSALLENSETKETIPVTDFVIFTGTSTHANQLRTVFDKRILFIANGAGHNPLVISADADIDAAVKATLTLLLYNQGQDCAAPNSVLVNKEVYSNFLHRLQKEIELVGVGPYNERSCRVGPISDPNDLVEIQKFLIKHCSWLDSITTGIIRTSESILEPTIINKPLAEGGNYTEIFAPIIFLQEYENDNDLAEYFENQQYMANAMYISVYGTSKYVESLIDRPFDGAIIHDKSSILHNTNLHAHGVERGTQQYGGYGHDASSLRINGHIMPQPTLPQRDIYEWIAKPLIEKGQADQKNKSDGLYTEVFYKNIQKLLRLTPIINNSQQSKDAQTVFIDTADLKNGAARFIRLEAKSAFPLLNYPNTKCISDLTPKEIELVRELRNFLCHSKRSVEEVKMKLYELPKILKKEEQDERILQQSFFETIYQLLFGKSSGPYLPEFLPSMSESELIRLLDV